MKVLKKSKMPDGTDIQIEDWKDVYEFTKTNFKFQIDYCVAITGFLSTGISLPECYH